jgi:hypothetical protein
MATLWQGVYPKGAILAKNGKMSEMRKAVAAGVCESPDGYFLMVGGGADHKKLRFCSIF